MQQRDLAMSTVARDTGTAADLTEVVRGVQAFTADLYRRVAAGAGNQVCSPYSVVCALAMARNGARGRTADEIDGVLHTPALAAFNGGMNALVQRLEARAGAHRRVDDTEGRLTIDTANSLWGQRDLQWERGFLDTLARCYGAGMRLVDYRADPGGATGLINAWTSDQTHGRIPDLVPPGVLDTFTRLVLVNAVYLKAPWDEPFQEEATTPRPFTTDDGSTVRVDMMSHDMHRAAFASGPGWRAARLSYIGGDLAMAVVVPEPDTSVYALESSLDGPGLNRLLGGFRPVSSIRVELPRWTFRARAELNPHLEALGMATAFDPARADFTGMTTEEPLHISDVLHEAFIAVDEQGTEAAAATAAVMRTLSLPREPPLVLTADRPFLFVLFDVPTTTPLFIGRVTHPEGG